MNLNPGIFPQAGIIWVPCVPDYSSGSYIPIYNLSNIPQNINCQVKNLPRGGIKSKTWSHEEDQFLVALIEQIGTKKWTKIAKKLNQQFRNNRIGKNCRERWNNHLNPGINKGEWSYMEDLTLLLKFKEVGRKWSMIGKCLSGRTENAVKNRWNALVNTIHQTVGSTNNEMAVEYLISHLQETISNPAETLKPN